MRVLVTGATGFIGLAIVKELISAGHQVTGLARSEASGGKLAEAGAKVHIGSVEDLDGLRRAASSADGAVHTAFYHKVTHMPVGTRLRVILGGGPGGIAQRFMSAAVNADRRAIEAIGNALPGNGSPFAVAFATLALRQGQLAVEEQSYDPAFVGAPRAMTEEVLKRLTARGVRTSAIRLPPAVHGVGDHGLTAQLIQIARKKKEAAYVGDGLNRWPSVHQVDAARLFRLALEKGASGGTYHAVAEEGIPFREIANLIGTELRVPVVSKSVAEASKQFGFLAPFVPMDNPTSSKWTQEQLGWRPAQPGLLSDLKQADYFQA